MQSSHFCRPLFFLFLEVVLVFIGTSVGQSRVCAQSVYPTDGLVLQLDAGSLASLADGAEVSSWQATVGGVTFDNYDDSSKPQYYSNVANLGGKSALYFDADCMSLTGTLGITGASERTVIAVWADATDNKGNFQHIFHMGTNVKDQAYGLSVNRKDNLGKTGNHYWGNFFDASTRAGTAGNLAALVYDGTKDSAYVNGWTSGTKSISLNTVSGVTLIGSRLNPQEGGGSSEGFTGYVSEVLVYNRALSVSEIRSVNSYLAAKYSLSNVAQFRTMDLTGAQINLNFEGGTNPMSGGNAIGIKTEGEGASANSFLRVIESTTKDSNNYSWLTGKNTASQSITGSYDLRFTNAIADGVSFILAGDTVDITKNYGSAPNGETPSFSGSLGIGYSVYNQNTVSIYWDGKLLGSVKTDASTGAGYNLKDGNWFTTQFELTYGTGGYGADLWVQLFDKTTGNIVGNFNTFIDSINSSFSSQLLLRGRTGGSTANADFDNIQVLYSNATPTGEFLWKAGTDGNLNDASSWTENIAPSVGGVGYVRDGTQTISAFTVKEGVSLIFAGTSDGASVTNTSGPFCVSGDSSMTIQSGANVNMNVGSTGQTLYIGTDDPNDVSTDSGSASGFLVVDGGNLNIGSNGLSLGHKSNGVLRLNSGSITQEAGYDFVLGGQAGASGKFEQKGGTFETASTVNVGTKEGTTGTINVSGGKFTAKNFVTVGNGTSASSLSVKGGEFHSNGITVKTGSSAVFDANTVIDSNTSTNIVNNCMAIGSTTASEQNYLTVETGATASTSKIVRVGSSNGSTGILNVLGKFSANGDYFLLGFQGRGTVTVDGGTLNAKNLILGDNAGGTNCGGTLNILNGGKVLASAHISIGDKPTANGAIILSGTNSQLRSDSTIFIGGKSEAGTTSAGSLNQSGDSFLTATGIGIKNNSSFVMSSESRALISAKSYSLALDDTFRNTYSAGMLYLGIDASKVGTLDHTGGSMIIPGMTVNSGSTATLNSRFYVNSDTAIEPTEDAICIGYSTNSVANKVIVAEGGTLASNKIFTLARRDNSYGEFVVNGTGNLTGQWFVIGFKGNGKVTISGANAVLTATTPSDGATVLGDNVTDGSKPVGTLEILNGGTFNSAAIQIGDKSGATGTFTMDAGNLTATGLINVGNAGTGTMTASNGSLITAKAGLTVGNYGSGTLNLSGSSTQLNVTGTLILGNMANSGGTMIVDGASVTTTSSVRVGYDGKSSLELKNGANLTVGGDFILANNSAPDCNFVLDNSTLTVKGGHLIFGRTGTSSTVLMKGENAVINFNGSGVCGLNEFGGENCVFTMEGGTFNMNATGGGWAGYILKPTSKQIQKGGTMNIGTKDLAVNLQMKNSSTYELSGGTLNVTGTIFNEGSATFILKDSGTLSANTVDFNLVQDGGFLSPGINWDGDPSTYAIGTTTLNKNYTMNGGTVQMEIDLANNQADLLIVNGAVTLADGVGLELFYDKTLLQTGAYFDLFKASDAESQNLLNGLISTLNDEDLYLWNISLADGGIRFSVNGNAIPEPASWVLLLSGLLAGLGLTFRRAGQKAI